MANLKEVLQGKIPGWREDIRRLLSDCGDLTVSSISVEQLFKGLRGVNCVVCDTSYVDPQEGLLIRGIPLSELIDTSAEALFYLLCCGQLPDAQAEEALRLDLEKRAEVPEYVWQVLGTLPEGTHPMVMLSVAMLAMQHDSVFQRRYAEGMSREEHWEATLEDALDIIARMPLIAAGIYRIKILGQPLLQPRTGVNLMENFAHLLGFNDKSGRFRRFLTQFTAAHCDHEGANASVLTSRVVNSSLSDLYFSLSAAMNSLAGPLHGLANQESVKYCMTILDQFSGVPTRSELGEFVWQHLQSGKVVPGFGHAVLRSHDPRYTALYRLGKEFCPQDEIFRVVELLGEVVPPLLRRQGKAQNPYPNIDGISGALLYYFGMKELSFYTVMFSAAQVLGICAQLIISRAINSPIVRPRSVTTQWLQGLATDSL